MNNHKNEINQKLIKLTMQKSEKESELEVVLDSVSQIKNKINKIKIDKIKAMGDMMKKMKKIMI